MLSIFQGTAWVPVLVWTHNQGQPKFLCVCVCVSEKFLTIK